MLPIVISVRGVLLASLLVGGLAASLITSNSKDKDEYEMTTGTIVYLEEEFQNLPARDKGNYRYLKLDTYPIIFEIYEPNSRKTSQTIDNLQKGDRIDIYYYETDQTHLEEINRFTQFIDHNKSPYFIRDGFQKQLGYILVVLALLLNVLAFAFWKLGKLEW